MKYLELVAHVLDRPNTQPSPVLIREKLHLINFTTLQNLKSKANLLHVLQKCYNTVFIHVLVTPI